MIQVIYSEHDLSGQGHTGTAGNAPEERKRLVMKALRNTSNKCTFHIVTSPEDSIIPMGQVIHDLGMLKFLETAWERWTMEWNRKPNEPLKGVFCDPNAD